MSIKKVIRTENTLFKNSQCLFVEYSDILKMPYFLLLRSVQSSTNMGKLFDLSEIKNLKLADTYLWYLKRNEYNIYKNFKLLQTPTCEVNDEFYNYILQEQLKASEFFYSNESELAFSQILKNLLQEYDNNFIHQVIIYDQFGNDFSKRDVEKEYGSNNHIRVEYRSGDFKSAIKDVPKDSSYVIADITRINDMTVCDKLEGASIMIPYDFDYNINIDTSKFKVDYEELQKSKSFKINFFKNMII